MVAGTDLLAQMDYGKNQKNEWHSPEGNCHSSRSESPNMTAAKGGVEQKASDACTQETCSTGQDSLSKTVSGNANNVLRR